MENTHYHPLYGEAVEKSFFAPIRVYALIMWEGFKTETTNFGIHRRPSIVIHFHKRRLTEDQDLYVREGDFVQYGDVFYEIISTDEPRQIFGQVDHKMEIEATCLKARQGVFNGK